MKMLVAGFMAVLLLTMGAAGWAETVDFEELALDAESYYNGSDDAGGFESSGVAFNNFYDEDYGPYWEGFAYSNTTDTTTLDYTNQYSAVAGGGGGGSVVYATAYLGFYGVVPTITFPQEVRVTGLDLVNTTYVYLSMKEGYFNAKKFGGDTGDDKDWLLLTITGKDADGKVVGSVAFYLADFRFADHSKDYLIHDWTRVDLSGLGTVKSLEFAMSSSDNDPVFGMNTPAYFSVDNIVYHDSNGSDDNLGCFVGLIGSGVGSR